MKLEREEISYDTRYGKEYKKKVYWCKEDDVWTSVEVPKK